MRSMASEPGAWAATVGVSLVMLGLWLVALAGAAGAGGGWSHLVLALDPAVPGSLPDRCGLLQLAGAATLALGCGRHRLAGGVPLVLAVADGGDLAARLGSVLHGWPVHGKTVVAAGLGAVALAPAVLLWRRSCLVQRQLGRELAVPLLLGGVVALGLDALEPALPMVWRHIVAAIEESIELLLYALLACRVVKAVLDAEPSGKVGRVLIRSASVSPRPDVS